MFPPLRSPSVEVAPESNSSLSRRLDSLTLKLFIIRQDTDYILDTLYPALKRDVKITAREVIKWSVQQKGQKGDILQFKSEL